MSENKCSYNQHLIRKKGDRLNGRKTIPAAHHTLKPYHFLSPRRPDISPGLFATYEPRFFFENSARFHLEIQLFPTDRASVTSAAGGNEDQRK